MCSHENTVRSEYDTLICTSCGLEKKANLSIVQASPPHDMSPFPYGYSKRKRFAKLLDGVLYPTPSAADEGMFKILFGKKFETTHLLLKAMRSAKLRDKRYCSLHCFCKHFVSSYEAPPIADYSCVKRDLLLEFETVQFGHMRFCRKQPFFNYSWLLCVFLHEFKLHRLLRYIKKLRCKHRRKHYKEMLAEIRSAYKREAALVRASDSPLQHAQQWDGLCLPLDQTPPS